MRRKPDPFDKYAEQLLEDMKKSGREIKSSGEAEDIMAHMLGHDVIIQYDLSHRRAKSCRPTAA